MADNTTGPTAVRDEDLGPELEPEIPEDSLEDPAPEPKPVLASRPAEQRVTWAELFFDLVWVFAITELAHALAYSSGPTGILRTLVLTIPLWWGWNSVTLLGNASGERLDSPRGRLLLFLMGAIGLGMAVAVPDAYGGNGLLFAVCFILLRLLLWMEMHRLHFYGELRMEPFALGLVIAGPLFLAGALAPDPWRLGLWGAGALLEVAGPALLGHRLDHIKLEAAHLPERFGLIIIMALGETVVTLGTQAASGPLGPSRVAALGVGFLLVIGLWWTYFHFGAPAVRHGLETSAVQARILRDVFHYAHFCYLLAVICIAVSLRELIRAPMENGHELAACLVAPGAGLYFLGFCYSRWRMYGSAALSRFAAALACFAVMPLTPLLPAVAVAGLVAALVIALNVVEYWVITTGRPVIFLHTPKCWVRWRQRSRDLNKSE
ncbi:low temperature requirement protein A [Kitasatospora azatica]|uniref:low temperature requirement protein A n=1 Tax=Kitasatospora azatica TaxID=58347 RepID=UPI00055DF900|nr:low temperature requirement protein A [Kitasatospora azatica]